MLSSVPPALSGCKCRESVLYRSCKPARSTNVPAGMPKACADAARRSASLASVAVIVGGVLILLVFVAMPTYGMIRTRSYPFGSGLVLESAQMATFVFSTRNSVWTHISGMGFERAVVFHKVVGAATIIL